MINQSQLPFDPEEFVKEQLADIVTGLYKQLRKQARTPSQMVRVDNYQTRTKFEIFNIRFDCLAQYQSKINPLILNLVDDVKKGNCR